jgi:hypothetical protein
VECGLHRAWPLHAEGVGERARLRTGRKESDGLECCQRGNDEFRQLLANYSSAFQSRF